MLVLHNSCTDLYLFTYDLVVRETGVILIINDNFSINNFSSSYNASKVLGLPSTNFNWQRILIVDFVNFCNKSQALEAGFPFPFDANIKVANSI